MPKIFSASQIKEWDAFTIREEPITSLALMERAARAFVDWFQARHNTATKVGIVCGTGNNGGDGLAVARMLSEWNYPVKVWIVKGPVPRSIDFTANLQRMPASIEIVEISSDADQGLFVDMHVLIDAIFGTGLSRPADGIYAQAIHCYNQAKAHKIAIDVPSGLMADAPSSGSIVRADETVTFQAPKLSFFLPDSAPFVGEWHVVDIGLSKAFAKNTETQHYYLSRKSIKRLLRSRQKFSHKGDFGKALLIAGSVGKMGAAILASRSALRAGLGLLTVHIPAHGLSIIQTAVPEAMATVDPDEWMVTSVPDLTAYDVIGIGPGLGQAIKTGSAFKETLAAGKPMVIDADALNILSTNRDYLNQIPPNSILTPHPKEFERLVGSSTSGFERLEKQRQLAKATKAVVLVKGAHTSIALSDGTIYFNTTGNPGMSTGGSGDVLTGLLTGLLAQGYSAADATLLGVYLHGLAGDEAARENGQNCLIASDLIDHLAAAFRKLVY